MQDTPKLESSFALEQLKRIAAQFPAKPFEALSVPVFGRNVPARQYLQLHTDLLAERFVTPPHRVVESSAEAASYDSTEAVILVPRAAIEHALQNNAATAPLVVSLIEAFGDYLNAYLRRDKVDDAADGDSMFEAPQSSSAGQRYAAFAIFYDPALQQGAHVGDYTSGSLSGTLNLTFPPRRDDEIDAGPVANQRPQISYRFSAGQGNGTEHSYAHGRIGKALASAGFSEQQIQAIYFGNWLRDYSQLVDPKIVRRHDSPKDFPSKLSREVLTEVVDLLALKEFHSLQTDDQGRQDYKVTPQMLGVYRPSEHIDNPVCLESMAEDPQAIDPDFEPLVLPDSPLVQVDEDRAYQRHVESAVSFMYQKLIDAMVEGPTPAGLRYFGEGLHTLEDFFAHSNFVELSLRKVGYRKVLPWVYGMPSKREHPVVTGLFSGADVLASIAEPLAKLLYPADGHHYKPIVPGYRSDVEQMLLILLKEHPDPKWRETLDSALKARDRAASNSLFEIGKKASWAVRLPLSLVGTAIDLVLRNLLIWAGDQIDDLQTLLENDPNLQAGTYPTHSQLAKDHDTHPFHALSALLAIYAVETVGRSMHAYWQGNHERDPATVAKSFICHPEDDDWQDEIVQLWAKSNPDAVLAGESADEFTRRQRAYQKEARKRLKEMDEKHTLNIIDVNEIAGFLP